jgi:AbrB family looped-hinge helix DNA binding protein
VAFFLVHNESLTIKNSNIPGVKDFTWRKPSTGICFFIQLPNLVKQLVQRPNASFPAKPLRPLLIPASAPATVSTSPVQPDIDKPHTTGYNNLTNFLPGAFPMKTTVLSSKGQVIIPKPFRSAHHWEPGQRLELIDAGDGILLKPAVPFPATTLAEVAACLPYHGKAKTLAEMEEAIRQGAEEAGHGRG